LSRRGIERRVADGLRITDEATLDAVVSVLGLVNTRLVAAAVAAGARAVGLTGADAAIGLCRKAPPIRTVDGRLVDLGLVGEPVPRADCRLLVDLCAAGYVPVVACIGIDERGALLNVNADILAARLAAAIGARRLMIAGGTAGVLDSEGRTLPSVEVAAIDGLVATGRAHAGMIPKLRACAEALAAGVEEACIVDGRRPDFETRCDTEILENLRTT
jgi:acetylglutamate kinase